MTESLLLPIPELGRVDPPNYDDTGLDVDDTPPHRLPHRVYIRDGKVLDADTDLEVKAQKHDTFRINVIPIDGGQGKVTIIYNKVEDRTIHEVPDPAPEEFPPVDQSHSDSDDS